MTQVWAPRQVRRITGAPVAWIARAASRSASWRGLVGADLVARDAVRLERRRPSRPDPSRRSGCRAGSPTRRSGPRAPCWNASVSGAAPCIARTICVPATAHQSLSTSRDERRRRVVEQVDVHRLAHGLRASASASGGGVCAGRERDGRRRARRGGRGRRRVAGSRRTSSSIGRSGGGSRSSSIRRDEVLEPVADAEDVQPDGAERQQDASASRTAAMARPGDPAAAGTVRTWAHGLRAVRPQ